MESNFQFSNPALINITYKVNETFNSKGETKIKMQIETKEEREEEASEALVRLYIRIGEESDKAPFYVFAEEAARFKWDCDAYDENSVNRLLSQNAPALLLSYLRPIIANITSASPYSGYNIPFINFTHNKD